MSSFSLFGIKTKWIHEREAKQRERGDGAAGRRRRALAAAPRVPAPAAYVAAAGNERSGHVRRDVLPLWRARAPAVHAADVHAVVLAAAVHGRALIYDRKVLHYAFGISFLDPAHPAVIRKQQQQEDATPCILSPSSALAPSRDAHHAAVSSRRPNSPDAFADRPSPSRRIKCSLCRVFVSTGTRHCSVCNKCVAGFDHHCVYLNTCIGARNYPLFIGLLSCSVLLITTQMIVTGFAISRLLQSSHSNVAARITILCCLSFLPLLQLVCMLVLASFHLYLYAKGLRTHEFLQQWYRSRSNSSSSLRANTTSNKQHAEEKQQIVQIDITERSSGGTNTSSSSNGSSSSRSTPNHTDQEQDACEQVDTASACEPMALLIGPDGQYEAENSPVDSEQRRLV